MCVSYSHTASPPPVIQSGIPEMVSGRNFGQFSVDVNGCAFGHQEIDVVPHQHVATVQIVIAEYNPPVVHKKWMKANAAWIFAGELIKRLLFIIPALLSGNDTVLLLWYILDFVLLGYFARRQQYCPGCLYNALHVFRTGEELPAKFESKSGRFSGTKKWIVGLAALASLINTCNAISASSCFFYSIFLRIGRSPDEPIISQTDFYKTQPTYDYVIYGHLLLGILWNVRSSMVAAVTNFVFWFYTVPIFWFYTYLSLLKTAEAAAAKRELERQEQIQSSGEDQRHFFQHVGSLFSDKFSQENVNARNHQSVTERLGTLEKNNRKCMDFCYYADVGSYPGTRMFEFWVIVWEQGETFEKAEAEE